MSQEQHRGCPSQLPPYGSWARRAARSKSTQLLVVVLLATGLVLRADLLPEDLPVLKPKEADGFPTGGNSYSAMFQGDSKNPEPDPEPEPDPDPIQCPEGQIPFSIFGGPVSCIDDPNQQDEEDEDQDEETPGENQDDEQPGENPIEGSEDDDGGMTINPQNRPTPLEDDRPLCSDAQPGEDCIEVDRPPICQEGQPPPACIVGVTYDEEGNEVWEIPESEGGNEDDGIDSVFCAQYGDSADHTGAQTPHIHPAPFPYDHDGDPSTPDICSHASENCAWHGNCPVTPPVNPPPGTTVSITTVSCISLVARVDWTFTGPSTTLTVTVGSNSANIAASAGSWSTTMAAAGQYAVSVAGGSATASANVTCLPPTPTGLSVVCAAGTVSVNWDAVSGATYVVEGDLTYSGSSSSFTGTGLGGVTYQVRVKAVVAGVGESGFSGWESGTCPVVAPAVPTGLTLTCFDWQPPSGTYTNGYYTVFASWDAPPVGQTVSFELRGDLRYTGAGLSHTETIAAQTTLDPDTNKDVLVPVRVQVWLRASNSGGTSQSTATIEDTCNPPPCPAVVPQFARQEAEPRYADLRWEAWLATTPGSRAQTALTHVPGGSDNLVPASALSVVGGVPDGNVWLVEDRWDAQPGITWYSTLDQGSGCRWRAAQVRVGLRELLFTDADDLALAQSQSGNAWDEWAAAVAVWNASTQDERDAWSVWHVRGAYGGDGVPAGYGLPASCESARGLVRDARDDCDISATCLAVDVPEATDPGTPERAARPDPPAGCRWVVPREGFWEFWVEWQLVPDRDDDCNLPGANCWVQLGRGMSRFLKLAGSGGLHDLNQP